MHLPTVLLALATTALASPQTSITLSLPPSSSLPNPFSLPPSTRASLSSLGVLHTAPLSTQNTFVFRNVTPGSYLADIACATHAFAPLRVDVDVVSGSEGGGGGVTVKAWETYRGNEWGNRGEGVPPVGEKGWLEVRVLGGKGYYSERSKCLSSSSFPSGGSVCVLTGGIVNAFAILRSPMILLGLFSLAIMFGMPYLVDNSEFPPPREKGRS